MTENKASNDVPTAADAIRGTIISIQAWATVFTHWVVDARPDEPPQGMLKALANLEAWMRDVLDELDAGGGPRNMADGALTCDVLAKMMAAIAETGVQISRDIKEGKP